MISKYPIVCLCGSTKFKEEFEEANKHLTLQGKIVLSVGVFGHADGEVISDKTKNMLDDMHKRKIDLSDEVFIINKDHYIGNSTKEELRYAIDCGKVIKFLENYNGAMIDAVLESQDEVVEKLKK